MITTAATATIPTEADMVIGGDVIALVEGGETYEVRFIGPFTASAFAGAQPGEVCMILKPVSYVPGDAYSEIITPATRLVHLVVE